MSGQKSIEVTIETDGEVKIEAKGFTGNSCTIATKDLEMVLAGGAVDDRKPKPDFYASTGAQVRQFN